MLPDGGFKVTIFQVIVFFLAVFCWNFNVSYSDFRYLLSTLVSITISTDLSSISFSIIKQIYCIGAAKSKLWFQYLT